MEFEQKEKLLKKLEVSMDLTTGEKTTLSASSFDHLSETLHEVIQYFKQQLHVE